MKKTIILLSICFYAVFAMAQQKIEFVEPFLEQTFQGISAPLGKILACPATKKDSTNAYGLYDYSDCMIYGFSHTLYSDSNSVSPCDLIITPTMLDKNMLSYSFYFQHQNENAKVGYYSIKADNGLLCELTATENFACHKYTFPDDNRLMAVIIDLNNNNLTWKTETKSMTSLLGSCFSTDYNEEQQLYFALKFSKNVQKIYNDKKNGKLYIFFGRSSKDNNIIEVQVAMSFKNKDDATKKLKNKTAENFIETRKESEISWEKFLNTVEVENATKEQQISFYTAMYFSMSPKNQNKQQPIHQPLTDVLNALGLSPINHPKSVLDVFDALGLSPDNEFKITTPLFEKATINLGDNKKFVIISKQGKQYSKNKIVKLNGKVYKKSYISQEEILKGGTLEIINAEGYARDFGFSIRSKE